MNRIIVPTDFSETANNALEYACELAKENNLAIQLVHTFELKQKAGMLYTIEQHIKKRVEKDMQNLLKDMRTKYPNVNIEISIYKSTVEQGVALQAKKSKASIIIMGTHGTSTFKEIFIGSNAIAVIKKSKIPVLLIPFSVRFDGVKRVLLTLDDDGVSSKTNLMALKQLVKVLRLELVALHIETHPNDPTAESFLNVLSDVFGKGTVPFYEILGDDVEKIIEEFAKEVEADLICTIKRKKGILSDLLRKSTSKQMIYQYKLPILVLNKNTEIQIYPENKESKTLNQ